MAQLIGIFGFKALHEALNKRAEAVEFGERALIDTETEKNGIVDNSPKAHAVGIG